MSLCPEIVLLGRRWLEALEPELGPARTLRRELHAEPSGSGAEGPALARLERALEGHLDLRRSAATGGVGRIGPGSGPGIALRAELDALPMTEETGSPFASSNGFMHACGHDVHQAALVALIKAARGLSLPFGLVALLQPREETYPSGALDMTQEGVLAHEGVEHVIGGHVHPGVQAGAISVGAGFVNAAADEFDIRIIGRGGHAAYPHHGSDPVAAAAHVALSLPELVRRNVSPLNPAVISVGTVRIGDGAANVLPSSAHLRGTVRSTDAADRTRLHAAIRACAEQIASGFGLEAQIVITRGEPMLINDVELATRTINVLTRLDLECAEPMRSLGADDFSYFSDAVPSVMLFVGVETEGIVPSPALHDPRFLPTDRAIRDVARALIAGYLAAADQLLRPHPVPAAVPDETLPSTGSSHSPEAVTPAG